MLIPWMGGKRRLAKHLLPLFPDHTCYVEPFAGGAALFWMKEPSKAEVLNDLNGELVNLYRVVQHHLEEFVRQFRWSLVSRKLFDWLKTAQPEGLTDIQRAARFYYLMKGSFGAKPTGFTFGTATTCPPKLNLLRIEEELSACHLRLAQVTVENLDWKTCMGRYDRPHTFFYLDPPYWGTADYGVPFELAEYRALADRLRSMEGKALLSVNDCPEMREAFAGLRTETVGVTYTVGGNSNAVKRSELVIRNW